MQVQEFFKCFVVHFALTHTVLLIFHFTVGLKVIVPLIERKISQVSFQYAYLLPHDFAMTFLFVYFIDLIGKRQDVSDFVVPTVIFTAGANAISEMRVQFYFYDIPSEVALTMFVIRTVVHILTNMLVVYMYIQ